MLLTSKEFPDYLERWPIDMHGQGITKSRQQMALCCFLVLQRYSVAFRSHIAWQVCSWTQEAYDSAKNLVKPCTVGNKIWVNSSPPIEIAIWICSLGSEGWYYAASMLVNNVAIETLWVFGSAVSYSDNNACYNGFNKKRLVFFIFWKLTWIESVS